MHALSSVVTNVLKEALNNIDLNHIIGLDSHHMPLHSVGLFHP